jgi:hypothetical protein
MSKAIKIIAILLIFISCNKEQVVDSNQNNINYFKISQVNYDGKEYSTPIRVVRDYLSSAPQSDDTTYNTTPLNITNFDVYVVENKIQLHWISSNEQDVSHYELLRSTNSKQWVNFTKVNKSNGEYNYTIK